MCSSHIIAQEQHYALHSFLQEPCLLHEKSISDLAETQFQMNRAEHTVWLPLWAQMWIPVHAQCMCVQACACSHISLLDAGA